MLHHFTNESRETLNGMDNYEMLKQRFSENDPSLETDKNTLVKSFQEINLNHRGKEEWEFWSRVVDNYLYIVENESETLYKYICKGCHLN